MSGSREYPGAYSIVRRAGSTPEPEGDTGRKEPVKLAGLSPQARAPWKFYLFSMGARLSKDQAA